MLPVIVTDLCFALGGDRDVHYKLMPTRFRPMGAAAAAGPGRPPRTSWRLTPAYSGERERERERELETRALRGWPG